MNTNSVIELNKQLSILASGDDELISQTITSLAKTGDTRLEEFFELYENLYYEIPLQGEAASHTFLVQRSSELLDFKKDTEDIQPLLDEIAILREQILSLNEQLIEANTPDV